MTWKTIFKTYQRPEIVKKVKQVPGYTEQVSQFPLFLLFEEIKKLNNEHMGFSRDLDLEKLMPRILLTREISS